MSTKFLEPNMYSLETLFKNVYRVPVYQRPYSWDKEQIDTLMNDIFEAFKNKKDGYYTGNIVVYDKGEKVEGYITKYDIVDGQQRITSFALILLAIYSLANTFEVEDNNIGLLNVKKALWKCVERKYRKDLKTVELNSIEKDCFKYVYDVCFEEPKNALELIKKYETKSDFDERIVKNFVNIYTYILNKIDKKDADGVLDFADYVLEAIKFIVIETRCKENEVFSMFESINSKGKQPETIDLIKTYIFSKLDEESYEKYLNIWGNLIIKTGDKLYDYIYNFIKAYLTYFRQNIHINNFKNLSKNILSNYYKVDNEATALKRFLEDLNEKVKFYNMLYSTEEAYKLIKSNKFRYYFEIFIKAGYQHPRALFFRTFVEYSEGKITKEEAIDVFVEAIIFMLKFLTISDRDSKDAISTFSNILNYIYGKKVDKDAVIYYCENELKTKGITDKNLKSILNTLDCYSQKRELSIPLIALYESVSADGKNISYDQAYYIIKNFKDIFSLDHLLVQNPKEEDKNFKYYCNKDKELVLKEGNDFPDNIVSGMEYDTFVKTILNRIGNLNIQYQDKNSARQNGAIALPEYNDFTTYKQIVERGNNIVNDIIDKYFPKMKVSNEKIKEINNYSNKTKNLLKMDEIIELGILKPGDKIYITLSPEESLATLLDSKYVNYKGEKMTINEWGCKVTGWKAIRIYQYLVKEGEEETIQQIRERIEKI